MPSLKGGTTGSSPLEDGFQMLSLGASREAVFCPEGQKAAVEDTGRINTGRRVAMQSIQLFVRLGGQSQVEERFLASSSVYWNELLCS